MKHQITTTSAINAPAPVVPPETSPFVNGTVDLHKELIPETLTYGEDGMGFVESHSQEKDTDGNPVRVTKHRIRVDCLHWAPNHSINDCRFGCGRVSR